MFTHSENMPQKAIITLNHTRYTPPALKQLCSEKMKGDTAQWEKDIFSFISLWLQMDNSIEVHTSGSTGKPKKIELRKAWMEYSARQTCRFFGLDANSSALLCLPAAYIAGKMMIVRAFVSGFNLIIRPPEGNPFENLDEKVDFGAITPFQLHQSLKTLKQHSTARTLIVGGGEISPSLEAEIRHLDIDIYATYGMTETSSHIALKKVNQEDSHYTVIGDTEIGSDERGCLTLANPYLFEGTLITNDIVEIKDDMHFHWLGRYDNIINSGGIKISPEEIEKRISHLRPEKMIIAAVPDNKLGQALCLVIEKKELPQTEEEELISNLKSKLNPFQVPKKIFYWEKLPHTKTGKVDRKKVLYELAEQ